MTDLPQRWSADELLELIESVRPRLVEVFARYEIDDRRAEEILSHAWVSVALTKVSREESQRLFVHAVESACAETRAALGPATEQEDEPYVH